MGNASLFAYDVCVPQSFDPREGYHVALSLRKQVLKGAPDTLSEGVRKKGRFLSYLRLSASICG
jgi:hypothetical protein